MSEVLAGVIALGVAPALGGRVTRAWFLLADLPTGLASAATTVWSAVVGELFPGEGQGPSMRYV